MFLTKEHFPALLLIGDPFSNLCMLLVLLICARPPTYDDSETKTSEALTMFILMLVWHFSAAIYSYWTLFRSDYFETWSTIGMILCICLNVVLLQNWVYQEDDIDFKALDSKQAAFYAYCCVEVAYFYSHIFAGFCYALIKQYTPQVLDITKNHDDPER